MRRRRGAAVLILPAIPLLLLLGFYWAVVRSLSQPGSAREALRQTAALSETLHLFLEEHRETLETLTTAAQAGDALPDSAVRALLDSTLEEVSLYSISTQNGTLYLSLDNGIYTGKLYTYVTMASGAPPLPDDTETAAGQTFWTLDEGDGCFHFMELLEENWYAEYECVTRG